MQLVKSWAQGLLGGELVATPPGRRVTFSEEVVKAFTSTTPQDVMPRSAILATFRGVEPAAEALNLFNTVWYYARDRAVVVKSALGWPVRELKIVEDGGRFVLKISESNK